MAVNGSFRDRSGFVFIEDGQVFRQVNPSYQAHYDRLMVSGLYAKLTAAGLLIPHEEVGERRLRPEQIPFISYPYEWSFSQLKAAALATLSVQRTAMDHGLTLKDASAFNIQFRGPRPVLIDTLSFEIWDETAPWAAYRQFCQHFLAPLLLMAHTDVRLNQLSRVHIDGIPLDLASKLLPRHTWLRLGTLMHVHLHARFQKRYEDAGASAPAAGYSRFKLLALIDSLTSLVTGATWRPAGTVWTDYAGDHPSYSARALAHKTSVVSAFLDKAAPRRVWDLGANTGDFSRLATAKGMSVVSFDMDAGCVERNFLRAARENDGFMLPLVMDVTNPSPGIGWDGSERMPLAEREEPDTVLALGFIHHLALANNIPLDHIAGFFSRTGRTLIVEFVPVTDPFATRLLAGRQDLAAEYTQAAFESAFARHFDIVDAVPVTDSARTLFFMKRRTA